LFRFIFVSSSAEDEPTMTLTFVSSPSGSKRSAKQDSITSLKVALPFWPLIAAWSFGSVSFFSGEPFSYAVWIVGVGPVLGTGFPSGFFHPSGASPWPKM
jgi:hypothetical protein